MYHYPADCRRSEAGVSCVLTLCHLFLLLLVVQVVQAYVDAYGRTTSMIITPTVVKETQAQVRQLL
jgi:hypothetical protein